MIDARTLLNYLDQKDLHATFFVVGSRVIERPSVLVEEYMKGHEISVHTWSHHVSTSSVPRHTLPLTPRFTASYVPDE